MLDGRVRVKGVYLKNPKDRQHWAEPSCEGRYVPK